MLLIITPVAVMVPLSANDRMLTFAPGSSLRGWSYFWLIIFLEGLAPLWRGHQLLGRPGRGAQ